MAIEDTLKSIDDKLGLIYTFLQSAGSIVASETPAATATQETAKQLRKPRATTEGQSVTSAGSGSISGTVPGDPEGTRYWVSQKLQTVYAELPGAVAPQDQSFKVTTAAIYEAKKVEFAEKKQPATGAQPTAHAATPAKTTQDASTVSSGTGTVVWKTALDKLMVLNKGTEKHQGREAVKEVLNHFNVEKVSFLEALNKHTEVLAVTELAIAGKPLTGAPAEDDLGF